MRIWQQCHGTHHIQTLTGIIYRLAESQEQIATRRYVDSLQEQAVLEELLETSKPVYDDCPQLDYLLRTPFRYPPLKHGSRFGQTHERGLFYGAETVHTTLAETAFYRFLFFHHITTHPKDTLSSEHTIFSASYHTPRGIQLHSPPFNLYAQQLRDPVDYRLTQQLGHDMRQANIQGFQYESARDTNKGICIAFFSPEVFTTEKPLEKTTWFCDITAKTVSFKQLQHKEVIVFGLEQFLVDGQLPAPAA